MDFDFTTEQSQLKNSVDRFMAAQYGSLEQREAHRRNTGGFRPENWQGFAELGLLGMPFSEDEGGYGGGPVETLIVMEAMGRALALEPYYASLVLGATALRYGASDAQKARMIPSVVEGALKLSVAFVEPQSRYVLNNVTTTAVKTADGFLINGRKGVVINGDSADFIIVVARTSGAQTDSNGLSLFLVPVETDGVKRHSYDTYDGGRACDLDLADVRVTDDALIGPVDGAWPVIERVNEAGIAALAAEAVGCMEALHELTVEYLKTRKQFGVTIGSFQALQHRSVDMFLMLEQARSMAFYAAMMVDSDDAAERRAALSAVKVQINKSARFIGQQAVQLHGGIGMTMEYIGAHYFKRLTLIESLLGDTPHHLKTVVSAGGLIHAQ